MSHTLLVLTVAGVELLFATGIHGQVLPPPVLGQTVRITIQDGFRREGVLRAITSDSLTIEIGKGAWPRTYALADLRRIEEKTGTFLSARTFLVTVGVTAVVGGLLGTIAYQPCHDQGFMACFMAPESRGEAIAWGAIAGGVVGLPLGLALMSTVRWEPRMVPERPPSVGLGLAFKTPLPAW